MAHSSGFSITGLTILNGGDGYASNATYTLVALDPGQGSGFAGTCTTDGNGVVTSTNITNNGSNYSSGSWSYDITGSFISTPRLISNATYTNRMVDGEPVYLDSSGLDFPNKTFGFHDGWGYLQVLQYKGIETSPTHHYSGSKGWRLPQPEVSSSAQYGNTHDDPKPLTFGGPHPGRLYYVERSNSREPGSFTSISILDTKMQGSGSIIVPTIGYANTVSINSINVEKGISGNTSNSDIHDLYQAFNTVARTSKKNFDWFGKGPIYQVNSPHPIRFDEFYSTDFDSYGGSGCFSVDTHITLANGTTEKIEDLSIGQQVLTLILPTMPLDFDAEDTWKDWEADTLDGASFSSATITEIYFDWYESYYILNNRIKVTYEHPFFVKKNSKYQFVKTTDLVVGDEILTDTSGSFTFETLTNIERVNEDLETVNLNVEPSDVYFAGGVLVHNVHDK